MTATKGIWVELKVGRMFFCALPIIFGVAATPVFAATNKPANTPASSVLVAVATVHVAKKPSGKIAPAAISADAAQCASKQADEVTTSVDKESPYSDISAVKNNSSEEAETPANGSNQYLVRDKLQLSLETRSAEIDSPKSCKPD